MFLLFFVAGGGLMSSVISTIPPNLPLKGRLVARLCLALLCNSESCLQVVQESVRNVDMESYYNRRSSNVSPVFRCGGGRTDVLSPIYIPLNTLCK